MNQSLFKNGILSTPWTTASGEYSCAALFDIGLAAKHCAIIHIPKYANWLARMYDAYAILESISMLIGPLPISIMQGLYGWRR